MDRTDLLLFWTIGVPFFILLTALVVRLAYEVHPVASVAAAAFLAMNYTHYARKALAP